MHAIITKAIGDKLYLAPLDDKNIGRVLDIGTGTGICTLINDLATAQSTLARFCLLMLS